MSNEERQALLTAADETDRLRRVMLATAEEGQVVASVGGAPPRLRLIKSE